MRKGFFAVFLVLLSMLFFSSTTHTIEFKKGTSSLTPENQELGIVMRLIGGKGAVLRSGKELKLTFRVNQPGYVIIYNIDSDGFINLIYPYDGKLKKAEKNKVYTIPQNGSSLTLKAGKKTGIEYIQALAVKDKNDIDERELYFLSQDFELPKDKRFRTETDPYLSFNMIDKTIVKNIRNNPPASDHTYFFVNKRIDYPSYLCGQCHGTDNFSNPYGEECTEITIEKNYYEKKVGYPYPPLFNITHQGEAEEIDYSSTTYYENNLSNNWDDELLSSNENDIYLTINYGYGWYNSPFYYSGYYPYNNYYWYPSYSYMDSFYWGFGFNWGYNNWYGYYSPYTWYYPYYHQYDYCWNNVYDGRRSIYASRRFTKHPLSYQTSSNRIRHNKALANSKLVKRRITRLATKNRDQSGLSRILSPWRTTSSRKINPRGNTTYRENVKRRTVYGASNRNNTIRTNPTRKARTANRAEDTRRIYNPTRTTKKRLSTEPNRTRIKTEGSKNYNGDRTQPARRVDKPQSRSKQSTNPRSRTQSTKKSSTGSHSSAKSTSRRSSTSNRSSSNSRNKSSSSSRSSSSSGKSSRSSSRGRR
ncbi:DUF4384 domain-containing protein [bacterium]|nr:DUF4384 domain-containing protein [bacterium]